MQRDHFLSSWVHWLTRLSIFGILCLMQQPSAWMDALDGSVPNRLEVASDEFDARGPVDTAFVEQVFHAICQSGIRHPRVVMRQAILETGWFRSPFLMTRNNLFAFRRGHYLRFDQFGHSILFYKAWQDKNMPTLVDDYYRFLDQIKYGSPDYTSHLKNITWNRDCPSIPVADRAVTWFSRA
ncbi:glucosaminidase domain-containing protein [Limnohabitans sp. T6-20]|uniref:glucosaminidase domain-containing protein n=1 Tax=Limnohabitans sp. T6-20 TaxID=1100725 RepID=UPI000D39F7E0|nr:glucosaminidase domain-containing protein [Limnohabitans sp. T6-20]PUE12334.1 hypothetical protein B9Z33_01975 [Limnohabitans sp. T6-20]